jgi:hypothetical protein
MSHTATMPTSVECNISLHIVTDILMQDGVSVYSYDRYGDGVPRIVAPESPVFVAYGTAAFVNSRGLRL